MANKKLQVFISSTFTDLKEERQAAVEAILSAGHIPAGMELFAAGDESQMTVIKRWIDESDVYLLLLGGRYGSIETRTGKSYTHLEYEYAVETGKPLFSIVTSPEALDLKTRRIGLSVIDQESGKELKAFRDQVLKNIVKFWLDIKDIKLAIYETLADFARKEDLVGWVRSNKAMDTAVVAESIAQLTKENSELRERLNKASSPLYSGLTYEELEKMVRTEIYVSGGQQHNLYEHLLKQGSRYTAGVWLSLATEEIVGLLKYKLIHQPQNNGTKKKYLFTEDGHNFYLKTIFLNTIYAS